MGNVAEKVLPAERGTYALILRNSEPGVIRIGALGSISARPGYYIYVGSAFGPGGLSARVSRHLNGSQKRHWHIDYLRQQMHPEAVWFESHAIIQEHHWAATFAQADQISIPVPRFGASDCRCTSHLFYSTAMPLLSAFCNLLQSKGTASNPDIRIREIRGLRGQ